VPAPPAAGSTFTAKNWTFANASRTDSAFGAITLIDSGIAMVAGTVYHFTISVDPVNETYVGSVGNGSTTFTSGTLNWRNAVGNPNTSGGYFNATATTDGAETRSYSLDSLNIVPEPTSLGAFGCAALMIGLRRRK
jgi:hypothetical protein